MSAPSVVRRAVQARNLNFSAAFEQMCNVVAIAGTMEPTATLKKLVLQCFLVEPSKRFSAVDTFAHTLDARFGLEVPEAQLQKVLDELQQDESLTLVQGAYTLPTSLRSELQKHVKDTSELELRVREKWLTEVAARNPELDPVRAWAILQGYLAKVFRRHGVQAVRLLDPAFDNDPEHGRSLRALLEEALLSQGLGDGLDDYRAVTLDFLNRVGEHHDRAGYIAQLADTAYAYFSLAIAVAPSVICRCRLRMTADKEHKKAI